AGGLPAIPVDYVSGVRRPQVDHDAGASGQPIAGDQRQPAIHSQTPVVLVAIADTLHLLARPGKQRRTLEPAGQLIEDHLRFIFRAVTHQPASMYLSLLTAQQTLQFYPVLHHVALTPTPPPAQPPPSDQAVTDDQ